MAYQPKSYRKFAATTATAAMVASAVAPVASLAAGFTDVAPQYKDAVDFLVSTGATNGKTETQFGVYEQITRLDAAVILAKVLKLDVDNAKDAGFTDVPKDRAKYVNALVEAGILNGKSEGKFGAYDNLTRVEMAKIIANAYKLEKQNDNALPFTDVNATWAPFVKALYDNGVTSGKTETSFGAYENITRGDFARFVYRAANLNVDVDPEVVSVSAINTNQIEIKFNKELDVKSAENLGNYSVKKVNDSVELVKSAGKAELSEDKKTVILTLDASYTPTPLNQETLNVVVDNILTADGKAIPKETREVKVFDNTVPTILGVKQVAPDQFDVVFSEPVTSTSKLALTSALRINKGAYSFNVETRVENPKLSPNVVRIITSSKLADGDYTLNVGTGIVDYAGFKVAPQDVAFKVQKDTTAITATVKKVEGNKVFVEFNKPVSNFSDSNVEYYLDYAGNSSFKGTATADPANEKGIIVTFGSPVTPGSHKLIVSYVKADGKQIQDAYENKFAATSIDFTVNADNTAPTVTKVEFNKQTGKIEVTFSEPVKGADVLDAYELKDADGNKVNISTITVKPNTNGLVYELTPSKALEGTYTLKVLANKITDLSVEQNKLAETTLSLGIADITPPSLTSVTFGGVGGKQVFISFSEAMRTSGEGSILDKSLYKLAVNGGPKQKLSDITGASIALGSDNKSVVITLPNTITSVTVDIGRVADAAGNFTDFQLATNYAGTADGALTVLAGGTSGATLKSDIMPASKQLNVISDSKVEFYVDGHLSGLDASKIKIQNATGTTDVATATAATYTNQVVTLNDGSKKAVAKVVATFAPNTFNTNGTFAVASGAQLKVLAQGLTTILGTDLSTPITIAAANFADKAKPVIAKYDHDANAATDAVAKVEALDNSDSDGLVDTIEITFSEDMAPLTASGAAAASLFEVEGYTVKAASIAAGTPDTAVLTVEAKDPATASQAPKVTVKGLEDVAGNVIETTTVTAVDKVAVLASPTVSAKTIPAGGNIVITFSEPLADASKTDVENAIKANVTGVAASDLTFTWSGKTLIVRNTNASTTATFTSDVTVSNVKDTSVNTTATVTIDLN